MWKITLIRSLLVRCRFFYIPSHETEICKSIIITTFLDKVESILFLPKKTPTNRINPVFSSRSPHCAVSPEHYAKYIRRRQGPIKG